MWTYMNLLYIRAAIKEATGVVLSQESILQMLLEENLISPEKAADPSLVFKGYGELFKTDYAAKKVENAQNFINSETLKEED